MQEQAAENGIIPHLMLFVMSDSPLKTTLWWMFA
uniref:Uncharacterized protein n=1 Tax=Brassica campestris TaxID=3711 RepID=A0A3P5ZBL6_BRACM|nr:unnamed protein product [Brassica rapa]